VDLCSSRAQECSRCNQEVDLHGDSEPIDRFRTLDHGSAPEMLREQLCGKILAASGIDRKLIARVSAPVATERLSVSMRLMPPRLLCKMIGVGGCRKIQPPRMYLSCSPLRCAVDYTVVPNPD
jgi:hypothetical protein